MFKQTDVDLIRNDTEYQRSLRYYRNKNDILLKNHGKDEADKEKDDKEDPLHRHDSRVSSNFHQLLVEQKASYVAGTLPVIDTGDDGINEQVDDALGDRWQAILHKLIVDASLSGVGWLHAWKNDHDEFRFAVVPPNEVVPIYKSTLDNELLAVRRTYEQLDPSDGKTYIYNEYWTDRDATFFKREQGQDYAQMVFNQRIAITDDVNDEAMANTATIKHEFNGVPFIPFYNNSDHTPDLKMYKGLIDAYDLVYNGFINDVMDVQQVILILTNYSGTNIGQFLQGLKDHKMAAFENDGADDRSGLDKLTIDIPVEARNTLLATTFENIFYYGQGVNPKDLRTGSNLSGTAIKMLYGQLELKAGQLEAELRAGVNQLIRFILDYLHKSADIKIKQTWTRASIQNDVEQADIISKVADHTSREAIAKNNPLVDDAQQELQDQDDEEAKALKKRAEKPDPFAKDPDDVDTGEEDDDEK